MMTHQERQVVLFLAIVALVGIGIKFAITVNVKARHVLTEGVNIAKININEAVLEELLQAQSVSEKLAARIIEYRNTHGPFRRVEELKMIKGIGDYRYEKLKEVFFVE
ncbi:MAG: helix-hairpin-helix domain-containing protein [Candidatus Omnitrophota bacterium]|nr:helix-hairpin-helix domain-containing protein [Candidatus Omnitrophota bacterium]